MITYRLPYKLLLVFIAFFVIFIVPFAIIVHHDYGTIMENLDSIEPLSPEQKAAFAGHAEELVDDIVFLSFYIFIIAFIFSLFFSRSIMAPVSQLLRAALDLSTGKFDSRLEITTNDELGEVIKVFNEMTGAIKNQNEELKRKDLYINTMVDPMWVVDEYNTITDINPAFSKLFGYERDEVIGSSLFDFLDEEGEKALRRSFYESGTSALPTYEISVISKTEGLIPVLFSSSPILAEGEPIGRIGVIKDFRQEAALREALKDEKGNTEAIMDSVADHLLLVDRNYRIVRANKAARVDLGTKLDGEPCHEVFRGQRGRCKLRSEDCPAKMVFENGKSHRTVQEYTKPGLKRAFMEITAYPVQKRNGEIKYVVLSMKDITERKAFEEEIEQKNRELTALNSISMVLGQSLRAEDIFNQVLDRIIGLMGMEGGGIFFLGEVHRDLRCEFYRGVSENFIKSTGTLKLGEDIPGRVAKTGAGFLTSDISEDTRADKSALKHSGIKGYACIPIRGKEKLIGVFFILSFNQHDFTPGEERTLNSMSEMMGLAFENIRLYEKMRELFEQNRQRRIEEQKNLMDLSSMMASTLEIKKVLASSVSLIKKTCRADFVWLLGKDGKGLVLRSASEEGFSEGERVYPSGADSIEDLSIRSKESAILSGITPEKKFQIDERLTKYSSACSIPIFIGNRTLGALSLYYHTMEEPLEEEVHFLQTVGSVLAVALERTRLYENAIIQRGMAETILESITDGVMTVDRDGKVISMNSAAGRIMGFPHEGAVGAQISDMIRPSAENTELILKAQECLEGAAGGKVMSAEAHYADPDGKRLPLVFRSAPVYDNHGDIAGVVYVLRDLSMERELDTMKTDFVRSVSHEFRTPLTAIVGMTEMILEGEVDSKRANDYMKTVLSEANRLSSMVTDVLDLAKIERGKEIFIEEDIDFGELLADIRDTLEYALQRKGVKYLTSLDEKIEGFKGDAERMKQLLINLIENSLTYSDRGCTVEVGVRRHHGNVEITVTDNGWGIDEDELQYVGEKFYRGKTASVEKGSGLGLALCKEIARIHGGRLTVESEKGKGTTVLVQLPERRN